MRASSRLSFATSNEGKFQEARLVLGEFGIRPTRISAKGDELQSDDVGKIAAAAAAALSLKHPGRLFVEDTGLYVRSMGGFPGPYASHAFRTLGLPGVLRLLQGSDDRTAEFVSAAAYVESGGRPRVFKGRLVGRIARRARGSRGFGFDPVFLPEGSSRTLGEMTPQEKCAVSHRARALRAMGRWLVSRQYRESL